MSHYSEQREFDRISGRDNLVKPIVKWETWQVDALGIYKGFLPAAYWPDDYVHPEHRKPEQPKPYEPTTWDLRWLQMVNLISSWSKDRSTKVGSVIIDDRNTLVSMGWNGFPRGIDDTIEARHARPAKYEWTEHAERNAIYNAAATGANVRGCTMYLAWFPCADCARAIIQSGITKVICAEPDWNHHKFNFKVSREMLEEAGVTLHYFNMTSTRTST